MKFIDLPTAGDLPRMDGRALLASDLARCNWRRTSFTQIITHISLSTLAAASAWFEWMKRASFSGCQVWPCV